MAKPASSDATTGSPTASVIKAYSLPLVLFVAALFFQLFVVPKSFPPSHYDILGIRSYISIEEVKEAYDNISSVWSSDGQALDTSDFIKDIVERVTERYKGEILSKTDLPCSSLLLLDNIFFLLETEDHDGTVMNSKDFQTMFEDNKPWLIQLCSFGSKSCDQFSDVWKKIGVRAAPFIRQTAQNYWSHASFAFVLWQEEESSFWFNSFEVESAPAIVILKDPGVKPVVYNGFVNYSRFLNIMEQNRQKELPQLRSTTSMELGCDARGYSRAGYDTVTWYCAVVAGRHSPELSNMHGTIRRVQEKLSNKAETRSADEEQSIAPAAGARKSKRLTFAWLDGEAQKKYCLFFLQSENSHETCGERTDMIDVPQLFIVRHKRNVTEESEKPEKSRKPYGMHCKTRN